MQESDISYLDAFGRWRKRERRRKFLKFVAFVGLPIAVGAAIAIAIWPHADEVQPAEGTPRRTALDGAKAPAHQAQDAEIVGSLDYKVAKHEVVYDEVLRSQVEVHVVLKDRPTERDLRRLLRAMFERIARSETYGFRYRRTPNYIFIYAFPTRDHLTSYQWLGMLTYTGYDDKQEAELDINERMMHGLWTAPGMKHGLSERQRKWLYHKIVDLQVTASVESRRRVPVPAIGDPGYTQTAYEIASDERYTLREQLYKEYTTWFLDKHQITQEQFSAIIEEGQQNDWLHPNLDPDIDE